MKAFVTGSHMIVQGAIDAGVRFYAGYPITPASLIYSLMMDNLKKIRGRAVGTSDEISAISLCLGASMRGVKAITATSGPGFSLMIESIGYGIMTETPVVVILAQRMGPATGAATVSAQGDLLFTFFGTSGSFPIPVISADTHLNAYEATIRAVNISEILRTPVILLVEKELTMTGKTIELNKLPEIKPVKRKRFKNNGDFITYNFENIYDVPFFSPVGGNQKVRITGSAHGKEGYLEKDTPSALLVLKHLKEKIISGWNELLWVDEDIIPESNFTVLSFGTPALALKEAINILRKKRISSIILHTLFPVPVNYLINKIQGDYLFVVEQNIQGQYAQLLRGYLPNKKIIGIHEMSEITPEKIIQRLNEYIS